MKQPAPNEIKEARQAAGLSLADAAELVHASVRAWQNWEVPKTSLQHRKMPLAKWELFQLKQQYNFEFEPFSSEYLKAKRQALGLTQLEAANLLHSDNKQGFCYWERGSNPMPIAKWELFLAKAAKL